MELYTLVIGNGQEQWKSELEAIKIPYEWKKGKPKELIRLGVGEVKLYKLYFPEEHLDKVMSVVGVPAKVENYATKKNPKLRTLIKWIRKLLKLKEAPIPDKIVKHMQPDQVRKSVVVIPIGTRKDEIGGDEVEKI